MAHLRGAFTLGPLVSGGILSPGPDKLTCSVGGVTYQAGRARLDLNSNISTNRCSLPLNADPTELGPHGEIWFEGRTFRSPSAFSVHVKRKVNPTRKADDGWQSVRFLNQPLSTYRPQLEQLLAGMEGASNSASSGGTEGHASLAAATRQKRKKPRSSAHWSEAEDNENESDVPARVEDTDQIQYMTVVEDDIIQDSQLQGDQDDDTVETESPYAEADLQYTWVQCDNPECGKWRRVCSADAPTGRWECKDNTLNR